MDATTIAPFLIFQVFFGLTSHQYVISSKAAPEDLSRAEIMLWRENTALATVMTTGSA